ncbi:SagB family peptide dehydrogenase [Halobacillus sp. Marseille-Q1614]|uniref:SagB/ThcOx family dehydrogenase n=1 Tax=Halobacillus sp. Marseille-Q1614 TaxID=2709134 RepID=UPI00157079E2|nr:SagB family peptide dehydrogenase [Halobacillus sp. Marseille-Q1614]
MDLDLFLHHLHFQSDRVIPPGWEADWEDAPLPFKIYRDLPEAPLAHDLPLSLQDQSLTSRLDVEEMSYFLWYVFGITQFSQTALPPMEDGKSVETIHSFRRFVPSGGALYPNELYIYLKIEELPDGIYHYDVAHHRVLLLREGNFDAYLTNALGSRCEMSDCFGAAIITTMFWKNFFKYNNFSYRLQGLDAGALIGQLLMVGKSFGFSSKVHFQFLDQAINHLLGLNDQEESTYAVIPISEHKGLTKPEGKFREIAASALCEEIPEISTRHYQRSERVLEYPEILKMNQHSMLATPGEFRQLNKNKEKKDNIQRFILPEVKRLNYDLAHVSRSRYSPGMDFIEKGINLMQLASLLKETVDSKAFDNDLDRGKGQTPRISVYGCFHNVEGLPDGAYLYDDTSHSLIQIKKGDFRMALQAGMTLDNVNLHQVPMCLHIVGERNHYKTELGYRGYRVQHMEAGMLLQRLLLTASALGMNGHPLLGFDVNGCDQIYELENLDQTTLLQIPVGFYHPRSWLIGNIHG